MAQIPKRGQSKFQVRVRIKGFPEVAKTFQRKADATQWASEREREIVRGRADSLFQSEKLTLMAALTRYAEEITIHKKGRHTLSFLRRCISRQRRFEHSPGRNDRSSQTLCS